VQWQSLLSFQSYTSSLVRVKVFVLLLLNAGVDRGAAPHASGSSGVSATENRPGQARQQGRGRQWRRWPSRRSLMLMKVSAGGHQRLVVVVWVRVVIVVADAVVVFSLRFFEVVLLLMVTQGQVRSSTHFKAC